MISSVFSRRKQERFGMILASTSVLLRWRHLREHCHRCRRCWIPFLRLSMLTIVLLVLFLMNMCSLLVRFILN